MNEAFDPLNLIILAVAVVIFLRLRSVLGRRTGNERKPFESFGMNREQEGQASGDNVVPLPGTERAAEQSAPANEEPETPIWEGVAEEGSAHASSLEAIRGEDQSFHPNGFLEGARIGATLLYVRTSCNCRRTRLGCTTTWKPPSTRQQEVDGP